MLFSIEVFSVRVISGKIEEETVKIGADVCERWEVR